MTPPRVATPPDLIIYRRPGARVRLVACTDLRVERRRRRRREERALARWFEAVLPR